MKKNYLAAPLAAILMLGFCQNAQADLTFSASDLLSMTIVDSFNANFDFPNTGDMTLPDYEDGATPMRGLAGSTAGLFSVGGNGYVYYSLSGAELDAFNDALAGGEDTLSVVGFNDNDDNWILGIWYGSDGPVIDGFTEVELFGLHSGNLPNSATLTLDGIVGPVDFVGVYIKYSTANTGTDQFHASWGAIPEPASLAIWGALSLVGAGFGVRRRRIAS